MGSILRVKIRRMSQQKMYGKKYCTLRGHVFVNLRNNEGANVYTFIVYFMIEAPSTSLI